MASRRVGVDFVPDIQVDCATGQPPDSPQQHQSHVRPRNNAPGHRHHQPSNSSAYESVHSENESSDKNAVWYRSYGTIDSLNEPGMSDHVDTMENEIEARKIHNNYVFGLKKWKSHVTSRPISERSPIVQSLYSDVSKYKPERESTLLVSNILYSVIFGWWLALIYCIIGCVMFISILGRRYGKLCFRLSLYFLWPFGKFIHQHHYTVLHNGTSSDPATHNSPNEDDSIKYNSSREHSTSDNLELGENAKLIQKKRQSLFMMQKTIWKKPQTYAWLIVGVPVLCVVHCLIFAVNWFFVFTIPIAKINSRTIQKILFIDPDEVQIGNSSMTPPPGEGRHSEIIMYTQQSFNLYYYKYTVDGVNVILANLLIFVILAIVIGFADSDDKIVGPITKCILSILAILPVSYYIGMAITSISAQSSFAVGAILNATFGSMVEVILFIIMLKKGKDNNEPCFEELVKSTLTGSIMCCILLVPGMSMVVGGLKYRKQNFNPRSANISSSLLFVAIIGVFAPTIFSKIYGNLECDRCQHYPGSNDTNPIDPDNINGSGFVCSGCRTVMAGPNGNNNLYTRHVEPLVYACAIILPFAYIIGLVFSMKTHTADIFEEFDLKQKEEGNIEHHGIAHWSRMKSAFILLLCATSIALCSELISTNIPPLLNASGLSEYFIGVTLLSIVSMLPEVVNGVQFSLQNNVNLGIEIGSAAAIQVCMVQLPVIVLANLIYPMGFSAVFNDIHLWAIIFSVIVINYIFQDGKSNYFQGSIVMFIYILLMLMYFFTVTPDDAVCKNS